MLAKGGVRLLIPFYMKRIILIQLFILCVLSLSAQDFRYYDLKSVKNDTTAYLYKNFIEQKGHFVDKPLSVVFRYYERDFEIKSADIGSTSQYIDPEGKAYICDVDIYWIDNETWHYMFKNCYDLLPCISITFKPPYTTDEDDFYNELPEGYTQIDKAILLKDYIVSDIVIKGKFAKK